MNTILRCVITKLLGYIIVLKNITRAKVTGYQLDYMKNYNTKKSPCGIQYDNIKWYTNTLNGTSNENQSFSAAI